MLSPDIITVESSTEHLTRFAEKKENDNKSIIACIRKSRLHPQSRDWFEEFLTQETNYEVEAARNYAARKGVSCHLIDDPSTVENIDRYAELTISALPSLLDRLASLKPFALEKAIAKGNDQQYMFLEESLRDSTHAMEVERTMLDPDRGKTIGPRDEHMANQIKRLANGNPSARIVHVGGAMHILNDSRGQTLYEHLTLLKPKRVFLRMVDEWEDSGPKLL